MDAAAKTATAPVDEAFVEGDSRPIPEHHRPTHYTPPVSEPAPQDPWATVRALALKQLDRFMSLEPKVLRGDDPDAIHDLRVASRRLQQVLDLLYPAPRHGEVRKLRRRIRRSRRALGEVRNADVQLARVEKILARKRSARRETWEAVRHYLLGQRSENFGKAVRRLTKQNLAVFYVRLKGVLQAAEPGPAELPGRHPDPAESSSPQDFQRRLAESLTCVWQAFEAQVAESHRDPKITVIHGVRIAAKRLRYLTEVLHELGAVGSAETLVWLRALQEHLGNWHDLEVLEQMMVEMVARPAYLREHLETAMRVERLVLKNRAGKGKFREKYFQMTLNGTGYRRVKGWVAEQMQSPELKIEN